MFANFFQIMPIPVDALQGQYDIKLVILSYFVASFASYIALDITGHLRDLGNSRFSRWMWLCGGAFAMGAGIWSMHFIGMLAFSMPMMSMSYDLFWTGLSMVVAVLASGFALFLLKEQIVNIKRLALGGIVLGLAIASMHYVGMEAMKIDMDIHYLPTIFSLSIVIALVASEAALWLALKSNMVAMKVRLRLKVFSAFIMGAAICGMHYTGMAAAIFTTKQMTSHTISSINPEILAITLAGVTFIILGIAFFVSIYKDAMNQQSLVNARQAGMVEVATSVLHNVGNVLNSVNVSATLIMEKISQSQLRGLNDLNLLLEEHKQDLGKFITQDARGSQVPDYIKALAACWQSDQNLLLSEIGTLIKNIDHIKNIVAMQQELGKVTGIQQIVSVKDMVEEAIIIVGLNPGPHGIDVEKEFATLKPIYIDKVKLMQILVNLLRNAKDSVTASPNLFKSIAITAVMTKQNTFVIKVLDNGVGVASQHLMKIFSYGFTTKKDGHGFGLHASANTAKELGGAISVTSEGLGKGAVFILELPCEATKRLHPVKGEASLV